MPSHEIQLHSQLNRPVVCSIQLKTRSIRASHPWLSHKSDSHTMNSIPYALHLTSWAVCSLWYARASKSSHLQLDWSELVQSSGKCCLSNCHSSSITSFERMQRLSAGTLSQTRRNEAGSCVSAGRMCSYRHRWGPCMQCRLHRDNVQVG